MPPVPPIPGRSETQSLVVKNLRRMLFSVSDAASSNEAWERHLGGKVKEGRDGKKMKKKNQ